MAYSNLAFSLFVLLTSTIIGVFCRDQLIPVEVGVQGSFFNPGTVSAGVNDTVMFVFGGDVHAVTQSSFENPCVPLPGGFSSGVAGRGSNFSGPTPIWNLTITNVSGPLWFFCGVSTPSLHCAEGMVGAINPPSQDMYSSFIAAARNTSPTAIVALSYVPSGIGAFATNSPVPVSTSVTPLSSGPLASSTSPSNANSTDSHLGAIIGGSIGGAVALGAIILIWIIILRKNSSKRQRDDDDEFGRGYHDGYESSGGGSGFRSPVSPPSQTMTSEISSSGKTKVYTLGYYANGNSDSHSGGGRGQSYNDSRTPGLKISGTLQPNRSAPHAGEGPPYANAMNEPLARDSGYDGGEPYHHPHSGDRGDASATDMVSIGTLAKEVAKVLLHSTPSLPPVPASLGEASTSRVGNDKFLGVDENREDNLGMEQLNRGRDSEMGRSSEDNASIETRSTAPPLYCSYDGSHETASG